MESSLDGFLVYLRATLGLGGPLGGSVNLSGHWLANGKGAARGQPLK